MTTGDYPDPPITLATLQDWARDLRAALDRLSEPDNYRVAAVLDSIQYRIDHIRAEETHG